MYNVIADVLNVEKYSFSKLSTAEQCMYQYKLNYIDKIEGENNGFAEIGSLMHSVLERYNKNEIAQIEMVDIFNDEFDEEVPNGVLLKLPNFTKNLTESYKKQCISFLEKFDGFDGLEILGNEEHFELLIQIKNKKIILNGFIDVIAKDENDNYYIIDYKSKSAFKNEDEIHWYSRQLILYSLYLKYKYDVYAKELWFVQFRLNHIEKIIFNENDLNEALEWAYDIIEEIENEQFYMPIDFSVCKTQKELDEKTFFCRNLCEFSEICEYWKIELE